MLDFTGQTVLILGLGESGLAIARWVAGRGATLRVADTRQSPPMIDALRAELPQAAFHGGALDASLLDGVSRVALSPGLSPTHSPAAPLLAAARERGLPVWGEIEFFARALAQLATERGAAPRIVGITGTNGKTTTTRLTGLLIERAGRRVAVAGNISPTALDTLRERLAANDLPDVWVLELSSFQLATCESLVCDAATVLNLTQDHLDWHGTMDAYAAAKARIFGRFTQRVLNRDDPRVLAMQVAPAPIEKKGRGKSDRSDKAEKADKAERADKADKADKAEKSDKPERSARAALKAAKAEARASVPAPTEGASAGAGATALSMARPSIAPFWPFDQDVALDVAPAIAEAADAAGDFAIDLTAPDEERSVAERIAEAERIAREKLERGERPVPAPITFGTAAPTQPDEYGLVRDGGIVWLAYTEDLSMGHRRRKAAGELPGIDGQVFVHKLMPADALQVRGRHNAMNALAALALARAIGCPLAPMLHALRTYRGEPHRVERVGTVEGVAFYDDSKGTNVGATVAALDGLGAEGTRLVVILGGDGKGQDFAPLVAPLAAHARGVVLIGRDGPAIGALLQGAPYRVESAETMDQAVRTAMQIAHADDAVLLSPGCASLDMFRNYRHRAEVFVDAVRELAAQKGAVL